MSAGPNKETIFHQACEIEDASQRAEFIEEACQGDESLRAEIERLLTLDDQRDSLLDFELTNLQPTSDSFPILEKPGDEIGPFKLLQKIGEGGMGVVYMAEQKVPVRRRVALKIIKPGMDTREVVARFEAERQALAMMDHPNIAKVLDCGATQTGRPYFVMELVKGVSITRYCDTNHLSTKERLELFIPVCQAIQHAHQKGIIHRDVKPSNILIAEYDHKPVPKIIDFGIAKALNAQLTDKTMFTQLGQIIGTIEYMSPEQAKVNQLDVDTRSDIYSLGVMLYELLTGATPFDKKRMRSVAIDELMRILREEDPPRPSTRLSTIETLPSIAANRKIEPRKLSLLLHGELDWIVMKAMEKDRGRRYDTASAFADDISNYLNDDRVAACPPSKAYQFRKFARRNKVALATGSLVAAALIFGIMCTSWQAIRASRFAQLESDAKQVAQESLVAEKVARQDAERARIEEANQREIAVNERQSAERSRDKAKTEAIRANTVVDVLTELFAASNSNDEFARPANYTVRELLFNMADRLPERLKDQPEVEAEVRAVIGRALTSFSGFNEIYQAADQLKIALKLRREVYGDLHSKTIDSILDLSDFYWKIGSRTKCKEQARKAYEMSRQLVNDAPADPNHVNVRLRSIRSSLRYLAWPETLSLCEEAIELARNHSANDNPHLAEIWGVFAESKWNEHKSLHANGANENKAGMDAVRSIADKALAENSRIFGQEHPMTARCLSLLGRLELANANRDGAERYFRKAFETHKKYGTGATTGSLKALKMVLPDDEFDKLVDQNYLFGGGAYLMYQAIAQFEQGNLREYQRMIAKLVENFDDGGFGPWHLANACSLSEQAVKDWSPVIELIRNSKSNSGFNETERLAMLGGVLLRAGKTSEAVKVLTHSTNTWKSMRGNLLEDSWMLADIWAYELMLAIALHAEGNTEEAKQQFIQVANEAPRLLVGKEFNGGGFGKKVMLLLDEAQSLLQLTPETFPLERNNAWSYVARGYLYQLAKQNENALRDYSRAIELKPDNWHLLELRAELLSESGRHQQAVLDYTNAIAIEPKNTYLYRLRADSFAKLGQHQSAIHDYGSALKFAYEPREASTALKHLADCYRQTGKRFPLDKLDDSITDPNNASAWHQRGDLLNQIGEYALAIKDYSRALELNPNSNWSILNRGHCHFKNGDMDRAIADAEVAKGLELANPKFQDHSFSLLESTRQFDAALEVANRLAKLQPNRAGSFRRRGHIHCQLKKYEQAITDYEKALELDPLNLKLKLARLGALAASGQEETSRHELNRLIAEADNSGKVLVDYGLAIHRAGLLDQMKWAVKKSAEFGTSTESIMHYNLGCGYALAGDTDRAFAALKRSIELGENRASMFANDKDLILIRNDPRFDELLAQLKLRKKPLDAGLLKQEAGNLAEAIRDFTRAIELNPQSGSLYNRRGLIFYKSGQFDRAREDFAKFAQLEPQNPVARSNQAGACFELGDFEQSIAIANAALKLNPSQTQSLQLRARSHVALKHWDVAIDDYTRLIEIEPEKLDHLAERGKAFFRAGDQEKSQSDFDQFIAAFNKAVEGKPDDWQTINRRGVAKTKIERWQQAINDFNKALELAPQEVVIRKNLANCHCELGEWKSAIGDLAKALELGDKNWLTYYHMALCQLAADDPEGYRATCQSMVEAFADSDEAATINFVAWTCSLAPDAVQDYSVVLELAEKAWSSDQENDQYLKTLAAIHFRMGEHSVALDQLNKVNESQAALATNKNSSPAYTWFFLALTHQANGDDSLAKDFLNKAKQWTAEKLADEVRLAWNRKLTLELLQTEANSTNESSVGLAPNGRRDF